VRHFALRRFRSSVNGVRNSSVTVGA
jgi:hypothetical protein